METAVPVPPRVTEYAEQVVEYVRRALGMTLEYDSNTLPVLDHYLRTLSDLGAEQAATVKLVVTTAGAYFGEVVRRRLGGRWETGDEGGKDVEWRVVLPTGLNFAPAGFVAAAIAMADLDDLDTEIDAPPRMRPYLQRALERMGEVSIEDYYSLCGRLDTLEHLHEVLVAVAAQMLGSGAEGEDDDELPEPVEPAELAELEPEPPEEPHGPVN
jgi:hypothetical protein